MTQLERVMAQNHSARTLGDRVAPLHIERLLCSIRAMNELTEKFMERIAPLGDIWTHFVVATVAVQCQGKWAALSTLLELGAGDSGRKSFTLRMPRLLATATAHSVETFMEHLTALTERRTLITDDGENIELVIPSPGDPNPSLHFWNPNVRQPDFPSPRVPVFSVELNAHAMKSHLVGPPEMMQELSSAVRATSGFSSLAHLFRHLGLETNALAGNDTSIVVRAVIPVEVRQESNNALEVALPSRVMERSRLKGFFDGVACEIALEEGLLAKKQIPWPDGVDSGMFHLFLDNFELASCEVTRWCGTTNWRAEVDKYFSDDGPTLDQALAARKDSEGFENGIARLLGLLGIPVVWYGAKVFRNKSDLAAMFESHGKRIVVLGECTVQKPSAKFTVLLTRAKHLEAVLDGQAIVIPAVFTNAEISSPDRAQAQQDGISLLGRNELGALRSMIGECTPASDVVGYLKRLGCNPVEDPMGRGAYE